MPRANRIDLPGFIYHIINRGNNKQKVFKESNDFRLFIERLRFFKKKYHFKLYAYCLMDNHFHLILEPTKEKSLSKIIQSLTLSHIRLYHSKYKTSGHLWQGRYKSLIIQTEAYLLQCIKYIEINPVKAKLVEYPDKYSWSSYSFHAKGIDHFDILDENPLYKDFGDSSEERQKNYRNWILLKEDAVVIKHIEKAMRNDLVIGDELFLASMREKARLSVPRKRGRPRKQ